MVGIRVKFKRKVHLFESFPNKVAQNTLNYPDTEFGKHKGNIFYNESCWEIFQEFFMGLFKFTQSPQEKQSSVCTSSSGTSAFCYEIEKSQRHGVAARAMWVTGTSAEGSVLC